MWSMSSTGRCRSGWVGAAEIARNAGIGVWVAVAVNVIVIVGREGRVGRTKVVVEVKGTVAGTEMEMEESFMTHATAQKSESSWR